MENLKDQIKMPLTDMRRMSNKYENIKSVELKN